ncbi:MAG: bifunctional phosphopantothenoylcysteine decarboxylase/phosphopantothenate--cysteine ligase CoaBC [Muribaculaceae bacterium]|nr:bifunctional phosphopantothenoylcysteine decarboxylase/phosphopantothenate--cysteine ligase CoaBC [Muribaculaceae bacterium]
MEKYLAGKHIVLGITGGIAAYKSAMLLRLMIKAGAEVQVVMTPSAKEFITPVTLSALSGKPVVSEFFTANSGEWHSHVDLGLWADAMVIAPATACTIGKMANGVADNMLVTTYLSSKARVFVAPAMDLDMMAHPSTVENLRRLRSYGNIIIEPAEGELASHLIGKGRMEEPENILKVLEDYFRRQASPSPLTGKKVLVTAGPTREKIDPVRYISNYSTGKMAYAIADELASRGADVTVVSGPVSVNASEPSVEVIGVESGREMAAACEARFRDADIAVMCAAVADYTVENPSEVKLKREGNLPPEIKLVKNPDIARMLGEMKAPGQMLVGFALETDNEADNALDKMERKNLDMIVLNSLRDKGAGFATDTNKVTVFTRGNAVAEEFPLKSKREVAADLADIIERRFG